MLLAESLDSQCHDVLTRVAAAGYLVRLETEPSGENCTGAFSLKVTHARAGKQVIRVLDGGPEMLAEAIASLDRLLFENDPAPPHRCESDALATLMKMPRCEVGRG